MEIMNDLDRERCLWELLLKILSKIADRKEPAAPLAVVEPISSWL